MGEGSAIWGGIWEILAGGGVVFEPPGGVKRFDLQGGGGDEGGNVSFGRLRRPFL